MKTRLILAGITAIGSIGLAQAAQAATYDFSYDAPGYLLTGVIDGTLQSDGDTILISSISDVAVNGVAGPAIDSVTTEEQVIFGGSYPPESSLDGATNNWFACAQANCNSNILFDTAGTFGAPIFDFGGDFGPTSGIYASSDWSISAASGTPEPAIWTMMIAGIGLTGASLRQRRRQVVATA